jgi:hypothetical protein
MPDLLSIDLLHKLERAWSETNAPAANSTRRGLSPDEIDELMAPIDLDLPHEGVVWWGWHDGASGEIGPDLPFMSLAEAVQLYNWLCQTARDIAGADAHGMWDPSWFPVTTASIGPIALDCSAAPNCGTPIRQINWELPRSEMARIQAESFGQVVSWWIDAYNDKAWSFDERDGAWVYRPELLDPSRRDTGLV